MEHSIVDYWLTVWARWMRSGSVTQLGYVVSGGPRGNSSFEDLTRDNDTRCAKIVDALIEDLPPAQSCAVHHVYLGSAWRFPRLNSENLVTDAMKTLQVGLNQRGVY